jgi:subfamily B ATP-binding cassette protein MsbA
MRSSLRPFLTFLYTQKKRALLALIGAGMSAACFGACMGLLLPISQLLLRERGSLAQILSEARATPGASGLGTAAWLQALARLAPDTLPASLLLLLGTIGLFAILGGLFQYAQDVFASLVVSESARHWRRRLFGQFLRLPTARTLREGSGDNLSRLINDVGLVARSHEALLGRPLLEILRGMAALVVAFVIQWKLTLAAMALAPLIILSLRSFARATHRASSKALLAHSRVVTLLQQALLVLPIIKVYAAQEQEGRRFDSAIDSLFQQEVQVAKSRSRALALVEVLSVLLVGVVAAGAGAYVVYYRVNAADCITVLVTVFAAAQGLRPLNRVTQTLAEASVAGQRLVEIANAEVEPSDPDAAPNAVILPRHTERITFENVCYTYSGKTRPALEDVNLEFRFGETIGLVGGNGSGKTTLVSLLPRLFEPSSGRVLIDGADISAVSLWHLRKQIAIVPQETMLLQDTIAENIAYGLPDASRRRIEEAAQLAQAHDFILSLPHGYDCQLGALGSGLSSGQRQRLAIARAILRDPSILILDEATSQIDPDSARRIRMALREIRKGRTVIVIAHGSDALVDADVIVELHEGRVVQVDGEARGRVSTESASSSLPAPDARRN